MLNDDAYILSLIEELHVHEQEDCQHQMQEQQQELEQQEQKLQGASADAPEILNSNIEATQDPSVAPLHSSRLHSSLLRRTFSTRKQKPKNTPLQEPAVTPPGLEPRATTSTTLVRWKSKLHNRHRSTLKPVTLNDSDKHPSTSSTSTQRAQHYASMVQHYTQSSLHSPSALQAWKESRVPSAEALAVMEQLLPDLEPACRREYLQRAGGDTTLAVSLYMMNTRRTTLGQT